jgi:hypothetical protein
MQFRWLPSGIPSCERINSNIRASYYDVAAALRAAISEALGREGFRVYLLTIRVRVRLNATQLYVCVFCCDESSRLSNALWKGNNPLGPLGGWNMLRPDQS